MTGGEIPAVVIADAMVRLIPGAIGDEQSALSDSFQDNLLAPPVYTRPAEKSAILMRGVVQIAFYHGKCAINIAHRF